MKAIGVNLVFLLCLIFFPFNCEQVFAANNPPQIKSITANPSIIYYATTTVITAEVYDLDGDTLTYTWTRSPAVGTISGSTGTINPPTYALIVTTYTAPNLYSGKVTITLSVYDVYNPTVSASISVQVVIAQYSTQITQGLTAPARIATDPWGYIYVTDASMNKVLVYNAEGKLLLTITDIEMPLGIAADKERNIYIADGKNKTIQVYNFFGKKIRNFGEFSRPTEIAIDNKNERVYITDSEEKKFKGYDLFGNLFCVVDGSGPIVEKLGNQFFYKYKFQYPTGIAVDENNGLVYLADTKAFRIQKYDLDGYWKNEFGCDYATANRLRTWKGFFLLLDGLAVDNQGCVYNVDTLRAQIQAFDPQNKPFAGGALSSFFADLGDGPGYLRTPIDAAVDCFQRLLVTNTQNGRIEIYNLKDAKPPEIIEPKAALEARRPPATDFRLREYYVFPNPAKRGKFPTIHLECGWADKVEIRIYNVAAELVHSVSLDGQQKKSDGGYLWYEWCLENLDKVKEPKWEWAYEYPWDISNIASGVYIAHLRATKAGYPDIKVLYKFSVIK